MKNKLIEKLDDFIEINRDNKTNTVPNISKLSGVYIIVPDGANKGYVGSSGDLALRINSQMSSLRNNRNHNKKLQDVFNSQPNCKVYILQTENREDAYKKEQEIVDKFKNEEMLFNVAVEDVRAASVGIIMSEERRAKISASLTGHSVSEETRLKISKGNKGKIHDPKVREQQTNTKRNHPDYEIRRQKQIENKDEISKKIIIDDIEYRSVREAARNLNIERTTINRRAKNSNPKYSNYKFID